MMKTLFFLMFAGLTFFDLQAQEKLEKTADGYQIKIKTSAVCEMCQYTIEKALAYEKGVKSAFLNVENKEVTVVYNDKKTSPATIRYRIAMTGYDADSIKRDAKGYAELPACCKDSAHLK